MRREGLQRLRTGLGRITLSKGYYDDVDRRVDYLLSEADQAITKATQKADTDTAEADTALQADVDQAIKQASKMVE